MKIWKEVVLPSALRGRSECLLPFRGRGYQVKSRKTMVRGAGLSDPDGGEPEGETAAINLERRVES